MCVRCQCQPSVDVFLGSELVSEILDVDSECVYSCDGRWSKLTTTLYLFCGLWSLLPFSPNLSGSLHEEAAFLQLALSMIQRKLRVDHCPGAQVQAPLMVDQRLWASLLKALCQVCESLVSAPNLPKQACKHLTLINCTYIHRKRPPRNQFAATTACTISLYKTTQEHIIQRLLPVKARMLAQLARQQPQSCGTTSTSSPKSSTISAPSSLSSSTSGILFLGDVNGKDDATAVSDGWVVGTPTPDSPGGVRLGASLGSSGHLSGTASSASSASLPRPCSSLSFADLGLGDLCGDQEGADDACGGVFLVGGDDCDDVNGSGIGLDLYDLGQVCVLSAFVLLVFRAEICCTALLCSDVYFAKRRLGLTASHVK